MNLARLRELELEIQSEVQSRIGVLCLYDEDRHTLFYGRVLNVGHDYCIIRLKPIHNDYSRLRLTIETEHIDPQEFRETKAGWFNTRRVADAIIELMQDAAERRNERSRAQTRLRATRESIRRLKAQEAQLELPPMEMAPSLQDPGRLDLVLRGLTEERVKRVLEVLHLEATKAGASGLWDLIHAEDDFT